MLQVGAQPHVGSHPQEGPTPQVGSQPQVGWHPQEGATPQLGWQPQEGAAPQLGSQQEGAEQQPRLSGAAKMRWQATLRPLNMSGIHGLHGMGGVQQGAAHPMVESQPQLGWHPQLG